MNNNVQNLYQKGLSLWQQKKSHEAFQCFQNVLVQTEDKPFYLLAITQLLIDANYHQQAISVLEQFELDTQRSASLQLRLASLHINMKAPTKAISTLKQCIKNSPNYADAYTLLAEIYGNANNMALASEILFSLMKQHPDDINIHNAAASYLSAIGAEEAALKAYQLCLHTKQYNAIILSKIANLNHSLGHFDKATEYNLMAIAKNPNSAAAYLGIATSKKFTIDDSNIIEQFNNALNLELSPDTITTLHFSLGKIYDDIKDFDLAFKHFEQANIKRKNKLSPRFDIDTVKAQFSSIKNYFTKQQLTQLKTQSKNTDKPIFIVGMPRSGTTLLERIFSSNENVFCAGEIETLDFFPKHIENSTQNKIPYPEILSQLPAEAMKYYRDQYLTSTTADFNKFNHVLDKNPLNFINIGLIKTLFPESYIIHCKRNPLDICLSLYFQNFAHEKLNFSYDFDDLAAYYSLYLEMMQHWDEQDVDILHVNYEDIVSDTNNAINQLKQFTGLEYLELKSQDELSGSIHTASVWQARQKIHKGSVARWKNYEQQLLKFIKKHSGVFNVQSKLYSSNFSLKK